MAILLTLTLAGCVSVPEPKTEPPADTVEPVENPAIVIARADLEAARALQAEWLVLEPRIAPLPVTLGEILAQAEAAHARGDSTLADSLAARVSRLSRLGRQQAMEQQEAAPFFPQ